MISPAALAIRRAQPQSRCVVHPPDPTPATQLRPRKPDFFEDFRRFFQRGLATLLPTLITLWLLIKIWDFLWESVGQYTIIGIRWVELHVAAQSGFPPAAKIARDWDMDRLRTRLIGVMLAILLVYVLGVLVGNFIGRSIYRLAETAVMKIPLIRAVYPAVKQVTDFLLAERTGQFQGSRVVAIQPHTCGIWSIGLVTGAGGVGALSDAVGKPTVTVFVPSSPTAFSGYVLVVPREEVVDLPLTVEEAMRLLVSGGVLSPRGASPAGETAGKPPARYPLAQSDLPRAVNLAPTTPAGSNSG